MVTLLFVISTSQAIAPESFRGTTIPAQRSGSRSEQLDASKTVKSSRLSPLAAESSDAPPITASIRPSADMLLPLTSGPEIGSSLLSHAALLTDALIKTETGRRRYFAPETAALSDGIQRKRACVACGLVRKSKAPTCRPCYQKIRAESYLTMNCASCKIEFQSMRAEVEKRQRRGQVNFYCGSACVANALRGLGCPCLRCGKPTGSKDRGRRYCSHECRMAVSAEQRALPGKTCPQCGADFRPKSSRTAYCGKKCADLAHGTRQIGKGNSQFKDGQSYATWFRKMRPLIADRDDHRCRVCLNVDKPYPVTRSGVTSMRSSLLVHHIDEEPANNVAENLILLCYTCHLVHHKSGSITFPWFAEYAANATMSMTSRWKATTTSLRIKYSFITVSS